MVGTPNRSESLSACQPKFTKMKEKYSSRKISSLCLNLKNLSISKLNDFFTKRVLFVF